MTQVKKSKKKKSKKNLEKKEVVKTNLSIQFNIKNISGALTSHSNLTRFVSFELFVF